MPATEPQRESDVFDLLDPNNEQFMTPDELESFAFDPTQQRGFPATDARTAASAPITSRQLRAIQTVRALGAAMAADRRGRALPRESVAVLAGSIEYGTHAQKIGTTEVAKILMHDAPVRAIWESAIDSYRSLVGRHPAPLSSDIGR